MNSERITCCHLKYCWFASEIKKRNSLGLINSKSGKYNYVQSEGDHIIELVRVTTKG